MNESDRILIIDDDEYIRITIAMTLKNAGYQVDTAEDGEEAIKKAAANFYNLALIDIRLPDMEGTQLLTALRDTTPKMVKIILTGYPALENAIKAINERADGYLTKPVKNHELLKIIKERLENQKKEREFGQQEVTRFIDSRFKELQTEPQKDDRSEVTRSR